MTADVSSACRATWFLASTDFSASAAALYGASVSVPLHTSSTPTTNSVRTTTAGAAPVTAAASTTLSWIDSALQDVNLRNVVWQDTQKDGVLDRGDMLGIFAQVSKDGKVSTQEFSDLQKLVANTKFFAGYDYVDVLATHVISADPANATYQGTVLGSLKAGSSSSQLDLLVNKWFRGTDHPSTMSGVTYQKAAGSLFPHAPTYTDVHQGYLGDCYFVASLGETALVNPSLITSMFIVNGDGSYTVRFYHNGKADYVTVDSMLPATSAGNLVYDGLGQNVRDKNASLWVPLAEKAYTQIDASGWLRADLGDLGHNSYSAIAGGYMTDALTQITDHRAGYWAVDKNTFTAAYNAHDLITFGSVTSPVDRGVVGNHAYAVVGYNASTQMVTLFNPWGINNGSSAPGLVTLNWTQMKQDFSDMEYAV